MAKSVRFDRQLESRLEKAAKALGLTQSEFIREAIAERCDHALSPPLAESLAPFIGRVKSAGGRACHTGAAFRRALGKKKPS